MSTEESLKLVLSALASGDIPRAESIAMSMPLSWEKGRAILDIAERADRPGLLEVAAKSIGTEAPGAKRAQLLNTIAKFYLRLGKKDRATPLWFQAITAARQSQSDADPANHAAGGNALSQIALDIGAAGDVNGAIEVAESIVDPMIRRKTINGLGG